MTYVSATFMSKVQGFFLLLGLGLAVQGCQTKCMNKFTAYHREGGGLTLHLHGSYTHWGLISAEGPFCVSGSQDAIIVLMGPGRSYSAGKKHGFLYGYPEDIRCDPYDAQREPKHWDFGSAWVDSRIEYVYLDFYWGSVTNKRPSWVNGKFKLNLEE